MLLHFRTYRNNHFTGCDQIFRKTNNHDLGSSDSDADTSTCRSVDYERVRCLWLSDDPICLYGVGCELRSLSSVRAWNGTRCSLRTQRCRWLYFHWCRCFVKPSFARLTAPRWLFLAFFTDQLLQSDFHPRLYQGKQRSDRCPEESSVQWTSLGYCWNW